MRRTSQKRTLEVDGRGIRIERRGNSGDCYPACIASLFEIPLEQAPGMNGNSQELHDWLAINFPGIGCVVRGWAEPREVRHPGYWIATVISPRFREPECHHCTADRRRKSKPPWFFRRDECPYCEGTGNARGLHAVVMENGELVWDPHPEADHSEPQVVGETLFVVTDPARLTARTVAQPLTRAA